MFWNIFQKSPVIFQESPVIFALREENFQSMRWFWEITGDFLKSPVIFQIVKMINLSPVIFQKSPVIF